MPREIRNWLRSPSGTAHWLWDEARFAAGVREEIQMRPGWMIKSHPAAYRCAYSLQDYDPEQVEEFDSFIREVTPGMVLFDIGAHFGLFSLAALHYGGPEAFAVAVDPSPIATRFMTIQARLNHLVDRFRIIEASVSDKDGWQEMIAVGVQASGYYVLPGKQDRGEATKTISVTLDQLVVDEKVKPTHIKIDVEGYEAAVLRGGRTLLSGESAPILFLELHNEIVSDAGEDPAETLSILKELGYTVYALSGTRISDEEILSKPLIRVVCRKSHNH